MSIKLIPTRAGMMGICLDCDTHFLVDYDNKHQCEEWK